MKTNKLSTLALVGTTATGKSKLAIILAKKINAEIVNIDSTTTYQTLNIGVAKPRFYEQKEISQHLINIIKPYNGYSVKKCICDTRNCIEEIYRRGKNVILVGGTMMYFNSIVKGLSLLPKKNALIRKILKKKSCEELYNFALQYDKEIVKNISSQDSLRIQRIIEIIITTKRPYSYILEKNKKTKGSNQDIRLYAILTKCRYELHECIKKRFQGMIRKNYLLEIYLMKNNPLITL